MILIIGCRCIGKFPADGFCDLYLYNPSERICSPGPQLVNIILRFCQTAIVTMTSASAAHSKTSAYRMRLILIAFEPIVQKETSYKSLSEMYRRGFCRRIWPSAALFPYPVKSRMNTPVQIRNTSPAQRSSPVWDPGVPP